MWGGEQVARWTSMVQMMEKRDFFVSILFKGEQIDFYYALYLVQKVVFSLLQCLKVDSGERDDGGCCKVAYVNRILLVL